MNKGLTKSLKSIFLKIVGVEKPIIKKKIVIMYCIKYNRKKGKLHETFT